MLNFTPHTRVRDLAVSDASQPILDAAEKMVLAARALCIAEINVSQCRTDADYRKRDEKEKSFESSQDDFETTVRMSVGDLIRQITT